MYKPKRPGPVTAAAVLFFVFGGAGLLKNLCIGAGFAVLGWALTQLPPPGPGEPDIHELINILTRRVPNLKYFLFAAVLIELLLCLVEVIAGIGLLKMRYWARYLGIFYAVASMILIISGAIYSQMVVVPAMQGMQEDMNKWVQDANKKANEAAQKNANNKGAPPAPVPPAPPVAAPNPLANAISGTAQTLVEMAYPVIILVLLLIPSTGKAFAIANGDAQPADEDDAFRDRPRDDFESRQIHDRPSQSDAEDYRFRSRPE